MNVKIFIHLWKSW